MKLSRINTKLSTLSFYLSAKGKYIFFYSSIGLCATLLIDLGMVSFSYDNKFMTCGSILVLPVFILSMLMVWCGQVLLASYFAILTQVIGCVVAIFLEFSAFIAFLLIFVLSNIFMLLKKSQYFIAILLILATMVLKFLLESKNIRLWGIYSSNLKPESLFFSLVFLCSILIFSFVIFNLVNSGIYKSEELLHTKAKLEKIAMMDPLTGVSNRRRFTEFAEFEIKRSTSFKHPLSFIILDIDNFKNINDKFGHDIGDSVLIALSHTIEKNIRETDLLARLGGEEFGILLPETKLKRATELADKLRILVSQLEFMIDFERIPITISLGVSELNHKHTDLKYLMKEADIKLYMAKNTGKNRVVWS